VEDGVATRLRSPPADPTAEFTDLGADFYQRRIDRARRTTRHLLRQLHALGYDVQLTETA